MRDALVIVLMLAIAVLFVGLVGHLFFQVGRFLWRLPGERRARRGQAAAGARRRAALDLLPLAEAERMARELIEARAQATPWESGPDGEVAARLATLNPALAALLRRHRVIRFALSGTEISADDLGAAVAPPGMRCIGLTGDDGGELGRRLICAEAGLPVIHEVIDRDIYGNGRRVLETHPSLFHYLLLVEAPEKLVARAEALGGKSTKGA